MVTSLVGMGMEIGDRIKAARERAGLTQKQLAEAIGVSDTAVTLWENKKNRRGINDEHLQKVAETLEISVDALMGVKEKRSVTARPKVSTMAVTQAEKTLLHLFRGFSHELQLLQLAQFVECAQLRKVDKFPGHESGDIGGIPLPGHSQTA